MGFGRFRKWQGFVLAAALCVDGCHPGRTPVRAPTVAAKPQPSPAAPAADYSGLSVDELINRLDQVKYSSGINFRYVNFNGDPIFDAICNKGDAAVEKLMAAYKNDRRKTEQTYAPRFRGETPNHVFVKEIALNALMRILDGRVTFFPSQKPSVEELERWWAVNRKLTRAERLMAVLAENKAYPEAWLDAARMLTAPSGRGNSGNAMLGESVRTKRNPSVTELLERRVRQLSGPIGKSLTEPGASTNRFRVEAQDLAPVLAVWDPKGAIPTLRELTKESIGNLRNGQTDTIGAANVGLVETRLRAGDHEALNDYCEWIGLRAHNPHELLEPENEWFGPFVSHASIPAIKDTARQIVEDPNSAWNPTNLPTRGRKLIASPLLGFPEFYQAVRQELSDIREIGLVTRYGSIVNIVSGGVSWTERIDKSLLVGSNTLADRASQSLRVCDTVALELGHLAGAPQIKPYRPIPERDQEIAALKKFLATNRTKLVQLLPWPNNWKDHPEPKAPNSPH